MNRNQPLAGQRILKLQQVGETSSNTNSVDTPKRTAQVGRLNQSLGGNGENLSPVLQDLVSERREYEMNLGKAMDTLRKDYPNLLREELHYDIYHDSISVVDPSGVQLKGINKYKSSIKFLRNLATFFYSKEISTVQSRMMYDFARSEIRMSFNVCLIPKVIGNSRNAFYVDGISVYKMDAETGKILTHKIERCLINNIPVTPPYGVLTSLKEALLNPAGQPVGVPVGAGF